ncbi:enoyl-CoA hydratase/isomerase family protein [Novosphingobium sp. G106]|uniref:enoyl-CoA hydratase-related protein n=1 Tax=Novosphingobium sp. G106 TaxID=2849500 RepID=UPI001C2D1EF7|nr:enoyl-CoA hydratase-related protein [Novosphingobium sp. G106]MBV1689026.1 enoyl-CoA hydratase/isomerase family protein [Novosphingobium sp. G106]
MSCADIEFSREGQIAQVRLNRPSKLNAITDQMEQALQEAWLEINRDDSIVCVILSGAGDRAFCVGADISGAHGETGVGFGGGLTGIGGPLLALNKPLIAAVQGYCLGGGFELAMCADIIVAADSAVFGLPETNIGVIDHCGVVHRAVRRLPVSIAMGMILAGERLSATDAVRHGLVNDLVPCSEMLEAASRWAERVASCSPGANRAAKAATYRGLEMSLPLALASRYPEIDAFNSERIAPSSSGG